MVTEAKHRPPNRLQSMHPLRALVNSRYDAGQKPDRAGRPVPGCMQGTPSPTLNTMAVESGYPEDHDTVCAVSGGTAPVLERCEAEGSPNPFVWLRPKTASAMLP